MISMSKPWQEVVAAKLTIRDAIIEKYSRESTVDSSTITTIDEIKELTQQLKSGQFSARDVIYAYISQ